MLCQSQDDVNKLHNNLVQPLLTDLYQIKMAYAYWKAGKRNEIAAFDLYFRKNPFQGEFTIFTGLGDCLNFIHDFHFSESDIAYIKEILPNSVEEKFFEYLSTLDANEITIHAMEEGSIAFPRVPLLRVEGPIIIAQLLETTLLTLINYASLVTTNAARFRIAAGDSLHLLEFGLRRAQGPDGGVSASKYAYIGGFDGTSNMLAGKLFHIPVKGTMAHAFVSSFSGFSDLDIKTFHHKTENYVADFGKLCISWRTKLCDLFGILVSEVSDAELASFMSFALAYPDDFVALIDTYDVLRSGLMNFCTVALALMDLGYRAVGVRLDSGDLAYLSNMTRDVFATIAQKYNIPWFKDLIIIASNDINEETIISVNEQKHQINVFGIGTHLGMAICDLMQCLKESPPRVNEKVLCRHPFQESKRAWVKPSRVQPLYQIYWNKGQMPENMPTLSEIRHRVQQSLKLLRPDHKRTLNPTPYKVSISDKLYHFMHDLWLESAPIGELS